ncbi:hypothetical protein HDU96_008876 [Phlyctochytrium bullatum]|nr:hypothetical protein HDU96_008876 [Phlyctochytrium bullatum]
MTATASASPRVKSRSLSSTASPQLPSPPPFITDIPATRSVSAGPCRPVILSPSNPLPTPAVADEEPLFDDYIWNGSKHVNRDMTLQGLLVASPVVDTTTAMYVPHSQPMHPRRASSSATHHPGDFFMAEGKFDGAIPPSRRGSFTIPLAGSVPKLNTAASNPAGSSPLSSTYAKPSPYAPYCVEPGSYATCGGGGSFSVDPTSFTALADPWPSRPSSALPPPQPLHPTLMMYHPNPSMLSNAAEAIHADLEKQQMDLHRLRTQVEACTHRPAVVPQHLAAATAAALRLQYGPNGAAAVVVGHGERQRSASTASSAEMPSPWMPPSAAGGRTPRHILGAPVASRSRLQRCLPSVASAGSTLCTQPQPRRRASRAGGMQQAAAAAGAAAAAAFAVKQQGAAGAASGAGRRKEESRRRMMEMATAAAVAAAVQAMAEAESPSDEEEEGDEGEDVVGDALDDVKVTEDCALTTVGEGGTAKEGGGELMSMMMMMMMDPAKVTASADAGADAAWPQLPSGDELPELTALEVDEKAIYPPETPTPEKDESDEQSGEISGDSDDEREDEDEEGEDDNQEGSYGGLGKRTAASAWGDEPSPQGHLCKVPRLEAPRSIPSRTMAASSSAVPSAASSFGPEFLAAVPFAAGLVQSSRSIPLASNTDPSNCNGSDFLTRPAPILPPSASPGCAPMPLQVPRTSPLPHPLQPFGFPSPAPSTSASPSSIGHCPTATTPSGHLVPTPSPATLALLKVPPASVFPGGNGAATEDVPPPMIITRRKSAESKKKKAKEVDRDAESTAGTSSGDLEEGRGEEDDAGVEEGQGAGMGCDPVEKRRMEKDRLRKIRNTEASKRSRLRKNARLEYLERFVKDLESDNATLLIQNAMLEKDKAALVVQQQELVKRISTIEAQLEEAHWSMIALNVANNIQS